MNWLDAIIWLFIAVSGLRSGYKGFIKEFFGMLVLLGSLAVSCKYSHLLSGFLVGIENLHYRECVAYLVLLVSGLVLGAIIVHFLHQLLETIGLGSTNTLLGMLFGLFRGTALTSLIVWFAENFTKVETWSVWNETVSIPVLSRIAVFAAGWLNEYVMPGLKDLISHFNISQLFN